LTATGDATTIAAVKAFLAVVVVGLSLLSGCSHGWRSYRSKHITLYTTSVRDQEQTQLQLEYAYAALSSSFYRHSELGPVEVVLLEGNTFVVELGARRPVLVLPKVPPDVRIGKNGLVVLYEDAMANRGAQALSYLFLHKLMPNAPLWLQEGMASYVRSFHYTYGKDAKGACFGFQEGLQGEITLPELFSMSWDQMDEGPRTWYQDTSRLLMDYVIHGDEGKNFAKLPVILTLAAEGKSGPDIMSSAFPGTSMQALGLAVKNFRRDMGAQRARGVMCPLAVRIPPDRFPDEGERQETPTAQADIDQVMALFAKLPRREGYPAWYPPDVVDRIK
jgi:hypothetical protein